MGMEGVHMTVFSGRPVWPLALYKLVMVSDHRAYLEVHMGRMDFVPMPLEPRSAGSRFLEDMRERPIVDWADRRVPPDQADRVLTALGLPYVQVKVVIDHNKDEYDAKVSEVTMI